VRQAEKEQRHAGHDHDRQPQRLRVAQLRALDLARPERLPHEGGGGDPHPRARHEGERLDGESDLVGGIGRGAVADDELRVEELPGLLGDPLQRHRVADVPDLAQQDQVGPPHLEVSLPEGLHQEVQETAHLGEVDGVSGTHHPHPGEAEVSVDEGVGDGDVEDVDQEDTLHRCPGVADPLHDGGEYVEAGGEGEVEKDQPDVVRGEGEHVVGGTQETGHLAAKA